MQKKNFKNFNCVSFNYQRGQQIGNDSVRLALNSGTDCHLHCRRWAKGSRPVRVRLPGEFQTKNAFQLINYTNKRVPLQYNFLSLVSD